MGGGACRPRDRRRAGGGRQQGKHAATVNVQLLAINDFHGNLEPPAGSRRRTRSTDGDVGAGGVEYLATWLDKLRAQPGHEPLTVGAGDLIGASPLVCGAVPRRADDRGAQRDRAGLVERRQPRVRRGHRRAAADAERRLPPGRRLPGRRRVRRRGVPVPRRQRHVQGHRPDDLPAVQGVKRSAASRSVHRHDAQGHAGHRHAVRRRRPGVPRRGADGQHATPTSCSRSRASTRSSCCCTRAASRTRPTPRASRTSTAATTCSGDLMPIMQQLSTDDRRRRLGPHAPGLQLPHRRQARDQRQRRSAGSMTRPRADDRPPDRGHRQGQSPTNVIVTRDVPNGRRGDEDRRQVRDALRPDRATRRRLDHGRHHPRARRRPASPRSAT